MIHAVQTFGLILAELLVLFSVISVLVALVNRRFGPDRIQSWMADGRLPGPVKGLLLGAITPFCSCSTLPVLAGMLKSGVALRTSMTFLISSPLLDPIIVAGVVLLFGWRIALVYTVVTAAWSLLTPPRVGTAWHGQPDQASQGRRRRQHLSPLGRTATRAPARPR